MGGKKKDDAHILTECKERIVAEISRWKWINEHGCSDPFWQDGCNMNLTRNHVISYKRDIADICERNGWALPTEYYLPTPPEVDNNYMAAAKTSERYKRISADPHMRVDGKTKTYVEDQLALF